MSSMLIVLAVVAAAAGIAVVLYNRLVAGRNAVQNAFRQIDVQLKRRLDLIPNLVESVKGYMKFEQDTLEKVVQARNAALKAGSTEEVFAANAALGQATRGLFGLMEAYPDLKTQGNVAQLMEELATTENKIAFARQHYNDMVNAQNDRVQQFPSNLLATPFGFSTELYWELEEAEKTAALAAPKVAF